MFGRSNVDPELIERRLEEAYQSEWNLHVTTDLTDLRLIVFSDMHKGGNDRADDFRRCKKSYHGALGYYLENGHNLVVLGDAEEFWESDWPRIRAAYEDTFALEREFYNDGRYYRVFGNHDFEWSDATRVEQDLQQVFPGIPVYEGLRFRVKDGDQELGTLYTTHGHQGTQNSDKYSHISRFFVRHIWAHIQRWTGYTLKTPATDFRMRQAHELAMYDWSRRKDGVVLITGHTHRPIFESLTHAADLKRQIEILRNSLASVENPASARAELSALRGRLESVLASNSADSGPIPEDARPSYFNSGCCIFTDGDITGIDISDGYMRLVRFPNDDGRALPQVLASARLTDIFARCRRPNNEE